MLNTLITILPFFVLIGLGFFIQKIKIANDNWLSTLNSYTLNISYPILIFYSLLIQDLPLKLLKEIALFNLPILFAINTLVFVIIKICLKNKSIGATWIIAIIYGNVSFLGIPVLDSLFNNTLLSVLLSCIHLIYVLSIGLVSTELFQKQGSSFKALFIRILRNPLLWAIGLGLLFNILHLPVSSFLMDSINMVALTATPVILIWLGIFIAKELKNVSLNWKSALIYSGIKLLLLPFVLLFLTKDFNSDQSLTPHILDYGMPAAIAPFALADKFGFNKPLLASFIVVSTVFSILTLSLLN